MLGNKGSRLFYRSGGTRGGQDQFKWEDVKNDKYRENYLGHSVHAPVGRWAKGKDLNWYAKSKTEQTKALQDERDSIREQDEDLINEALGLKKKTRRNVETELDPMEMKQLLERGNTERGDDDIQRVEGLGGAPAKVHEHIETLSYYEKEIIKYKEGGGAIASGDTASSSSSSGLITGSSKRSRSDDVDDEKDSKSRKHEHKEHKEHKEKKEKKHKSDKSDKEDRDSSSKKHKKDKKEKKEKKNHSRSRS